jgi:hypothetical protein
MKKCSSEFSALEVENSSVPVRHFKAVTKSNSKKTIYRQHWEPM